MNDPLLWVQTQSAVQSADAAWAAVHVYWATFGVTFLALGINAIIAFAAITTPNRERLTRDLELRRSRARNNIRAAKAGQRALSTIGSLERYLERHDGGVGISRDVLERYNTRLSIRVQKIQHFIGFSLRDLDLVNLLFEVEGLAIQLQGKISVAAPVGPGRPSALRAARKLLEFKEKRRSTIDDRLASYRGRMDARNESLEDNLKRVWSFRWLSPFRGPNFLKTERDD